MMTLLRSSTGGLAAVLLLAGPAAAQTSYPMITHVTPVAVQRGQTAEVTVEGQMNFAGAYKVLVEGAGVGAEVVPSPPGKAKQPSPQRSVKLKITVSPEAAPGVREFRVATSLGLSSIGQLLVVDEPVSLEKAANNTPSAASPAAVPGVLSGRVEAAEDVDYYKVTARAGQILTFEVFCARLQDKIHDLQKHADPILTLFDAGGRELDANDDFSFADPLLTFTVPKSGDYYVQVRDAKYDGDPRWVYALLITDRPYASHLYPLAANPGQAVEVEPVGSARKAASRVTVQAPAEPGLHQVPLKVGDHFTNPAALVVSPLPQVQEQEPNDQPPQATRITVPCGINGRVGVRRDLDHFRFQATKGKAVRFEVMARRFGTPLRSSLDSTLDVMRQDGQVLASNDDLAGKDAGLVFTPPADGEYVLRVRDLNSKGGEAAVYYVEADWARPDFTLRCDPDKAMIGPGSSTAWYVHVVRSDGFAGPVQVEVKGLPRGVTASPLTIPPAMTQGVVVLTAAADAPRDAVNVELVGTATVVGPDGKEETLTRRVTANQEIYFPGGGRGRFDVRLQSVAVTEPSDILQVQVTPAAVTLKPGQEVRLDVTVRRGPKYDKAVSIDVLLQHLGSVFGNPLPPGVTVVAGKSKTLLGTGDKGHIVLKAAADAAPLENVPVCVLAHVSINFVVKVSYASAAIPLSVRK